MTMVHTKVQAGFRTFIVASLAVALGILPAACGRTDTRDASAVTSPQTRPSILIVTLDTTRADSMGPEAKPSVSPAFNALAARGRLFRQAYATVPETLPSHSSIMTGLYPAGHGVHENARALSPTHPVLAERLHQAGYRTAAFVSSFVLARRAEFEGLDRSRTCLSATAADTAALHVGSLFRPARAICASVALCRDV
jgi:Sulfatase